MCMVKRHALDKLGQIQLVATVGRGSREAGVDDEVSGVGPEEGLHLHLF